MQVNSIAIQAKGALEARGEYVVVANASTGFFAVFPTTWQERLEQARNDGREGPAARKFA